MKKRITLIGLLIVLVVIAVLIILFVVNSSKKKIKEKSITEIETQTFTGTIYRNSDEKISIGDSIDNLSGYETEKTKSNIESNVYLKHAVEDDIIKASYVCIRYNNIESCLQGGDPSYYGTFDEMEEGMSPIDVPTNPTGNVAVIDGVRNYFLSDIGACYFDYSDSGCMSSSLNLEIFAQDDVVYALDDAVLIGCGVEIDGSSSCFSYLK